MKKAGFIAASIGTAVLLAAGAAALTTAVLSPNHGVEEANAVEVAASPTNAGSADRTPARAGGLFSWFGGGSESAREPAAARSEFGEPYALPGITRAGASSSPRTTAAPSAPVRNDDDDDDDDDDD